MMRFCRGDVFATPSTVAIAHGCNMRGFMGAGIAGEMSRRYPESVPSYVSACRTTARLGSFQVAHGLDGRRIYHLFTQVEPGRDARQLAIAVAVRAMLDDVGRDDAVTTIAMPLVGSGIGGVGIEEAELAIETAYESIFGPLVDLYVVNEYVPGVNPIG